MTSYSQIEHKMWGQVFLLALALSLGWAVYVALLPPVPALTMAAGVLAGVSGDLLALSFVLSSLAYYFNFADKYVVYRKYLGLMGYFFALGYVGCVAALRPEFYVFGFVENFFTADIFLGTIAMAILTMMALISHKRALVLLGGKRWKFLLGLGYVAYGLLVLRGIILDQVLWANWMSNPLSLPSVRMILTALGCAVLLLRVSVPFHKLWQNCYNKDIHL